MGDAELAELGAVWEEDLATMPDDAFLDAVKAARRRSQYMLKPADVIAAYEARAALMRRDALPSARQDSRALPQGNPDAALWTDEQAARNRAGAQAILDRLRSHMTA